MTDHRQSEGRCDVTDRLEDIKTKWNIPATRPMNVPHGKDDVAWLISEVERLQRHRDMLRADAERYVGLLGHARHELGEAREILENLYEDHKAGRSTDPATFDISIGCWLARNGEDGQ